MSLKYFRRVVETRKDKRNSSSVPGKVRNLQQTTLDNGKVELRWDEPFAKGNEVIIYLITYAGLTKKTTLNSYVIEDGREDGAFDVKVGQMFNKNQHRLNTSLSHT